MLIYLEAGVERNLMPILHYALRVGVGAARRIPDRQGAHSELFDPVARSTGFTAEVRRQPRASAPGGPDRSRTDAAAGTAITAEARRTKALSGKPIASCHTLYAARGPGDEI